MLLKRRTAAPPRDRPDDFRRGVFRWLHAVMSDRIRTLPSDLDAAVSALDPDAARRFAAWCARHTPHPGPDAVLALAEDVADGRADAEDFDALRQHLNGTACAATVVGVKHGAANAPAFLAAFATLRPDAHAAARDAARWSLTAHAWNDTDERFLAAALHAVRAA